MMTDFDTHAQYLECPCIALITLVSWWCLKGWV